MQILIIPNDKGTPAGKLADAEVHFDEGILAGLKLVGFGIWTSNWGDRLNVTVPSREYTVGSERRRYDLLRTVSSQDALTELKAAIVEAYQALEEGTSEASVDAVARQTWREAQTQARPQPRPQAAPPARTAPPQRHVPGTPGRRTAPTAPSSRATGTDDDYPF